MERRPACRIGGGVTKSGSPMPSEMTSSIVATISKKRRMPEGGTAATRRETKSRMGQESFRGPFDCGRRVEEAPAKTRGGLRSGQMDAPFIVQLAVEEFEDASVLGSHAEPPSARDAPGLFDGLDRQALPLPAERRRPFGISIARMTLDQVSRHGHPRPAAARLSQPIPPPKDDDDDDGGQQRGAEDDQERRRVTLERQEIGRASW